MQPPLSRLGDQRGHRPAAGRYRRMVRTVVRMPADRRWLPLVVGQDRLHSLDAQSPERAGDQLADAPQARKRVGNTGRVVRRAAMRAAQEVVAVDEESLFL